MGKKKKMGPNRQDKWYQLAKEQGYRSRASYKLVQLDRKYDFLSSCKALLDLCAAPGGWLQAAAKYMPVGSLIVGVDLLPIRPIKGVVAFQSDILTQQCRNRLKQECQGWKIDVVIHDGAPNVGGATWLKDAYGQNELVLHSLKLASEFLRPGGWFITKVFRSQDYNALLWVVKQFFEKTEVTKPVASRNESAEIYFVCKGYLAPKSIDKKLFDPEFVFKQLDEQKKGPDVLHMAVSSKTKNRARGGYEDGVTLLFKKASVSKFIATDDPVDFLGTYNQIYFDDEAVKFKKHPSTNEELCLLLEDLKVLGKRDFKILLKWRLNIRKEMQKEREAEKKRVREEADAAANKDDQEQEPLTEEQKREQAEIEDEELAVELAHLKGKAKKEALKLRKKRKSKLLKTRQRMGLGLANTGDLMETPEEMGLFSASSVKDRAVLDALNEDAEDESKVDIQKIVERDDDHQVSSGDEGDAGTRKGKRKTRKKKSTKDQNDDDDDDDDERARFSVMEEELDTMYGQYKKKKNIMTKKEKRRREKLGLDDEEREDEKFSTVARKIAGKSAAGEEGDMEELSDSDDESKNPLLVPLGKDAKPTAAEQANSWFSRELFQDLGDLRTMEKMKAKASSKKNKKKAMDSDSESDSDDEDGDFFDKQEEEIKKSQSTKEEEEEGEEKKETKQRKSKKTSQSHDPYADDYVSSGDDDDEDGKKKKSVTFEEVAMDSDWSSDDDAKAEVLAIGTQLLKKQKRERIINDAFNRYTFGDDPSQLPEWFTMDEGAHNKPTLPVTKDQVDAFKEQLKAINARPIKKIAEAKGRKRMKAVKRWEKLKNQANSISEDGAMSAGEKLRSIEKLYSRDKRKLPRREKQYVVAKKGTAAQVKAKGIKMKGPYKMVDSRMRSDARGLERAEKRRNKKGGGGKRKKEGGSGRKKATSFKRRKK